MLHTENSCIYYMEDDFGYCHWLQDCERDCIDNCLLGYDKEAVTDADTDNSSD